MEIDLSQLTPDVRHLNDMREVLYDKAWGKAAPDIELYYMYRKVKQENELNHSVTVIPAKMLGNEFVKTKGHVHIGAFQEIYTVKEGEAIFLAQKTNDNNVEDVFAVHAKAGESFIIPPNYGHITINPSKTTDLKTGDWSSEHSKSDYSLFEKLEGACYLYIEENGKPTWIKNKNYANIPELRFENPADFPLDLEFLKQG